MELNTETKLQLKKLLAKPALVTQEHIPLLQDLVKRFPYYQPLHLLLAKAGMETEKQQAFFAQAAMYTNGNILHRLIYEPQKLAHSPKANVISYNSWSTKLEIHFNKDAEELATVDLSTAQPTNLETNKEVSTIEASTAENLTQAQATNKNIDQREIDQIAPAQEIDSKQNQEQPTEEADEASAVSADENSPTETNEIVSPEADEIVTVAETSADVDHQARLDEDINNVEQVSEDETLTADEEENTIDSDLDLSLPAVKPFVLPEIENLPPLRSEIIGFIEEDVDNKVSEETATSNEPIINSTPVEPFNFPEIENLAPLQSELSKVGITVEGIDATEIGREIVDSSKQDHQETFEEIGELILPEVETDESNGNIDNESIAVENEIQHDVSLDEASPVSQFEAAVNSTTEPEDVEEESVPIENIASTDFFAFESNFKTEQANGEYGSKDVENADNSLAEAEFSFKPSAHIVSKYEDDKMPFTFLWWLAKTRKAHEQIFMPFVSPVKAMATTNDLQQQYVENIFHLQSPFDSNAETELSPQQGKVISAGNKLVEKFIKDDPQLKIPKPDQINNENKAKKSAEDNYDVVSETLADIYIEQMLYHKAIDTYQKLSLKFPEKSRYFADLILSLEKKN